MRPDAAIVLVIAALAAFGGPLIVGLAGLWKRQEGVAPVAIGLAWPWRLTVASALIYALAFNLVFFTQELFLVVPKALTPGLHPILFHNNHDWTGHNPLARLFQGTGALAVLLVGLAAAGWLARMRSRSTTLRLLLLWVAFCGLFAALAQAVAGAVLPGQDVGMAFDYLRLSPAVMLAIAILALAAMAVGGVWLARRLMALAPDPQRVASRGGRTLFAFQAATLPLLLGTLLVLPFRVPASPDQLLAEPVTVAILGVAWIQASAWRAATAPEAGLKPLSLTVPLIALAIVLAVFQLVLRPGVVF